MHDPWTLLAEFPPYTLRRRIRNLRTWVEIWHHDPSDYDSDTCGAKWRTLACWRHWRLRIPPLLRLRNRVIDRCHHCGGPGTRRHRLDTSFGGPGRKRWWWGREVYHGDCALLEQVKRRSLADHYRSLGRHEGPQWHPGQEPA